MCDICYEPTELDISSIKELEKLKIEVSDSLKKLENYKHRLNQLIAHDNDVDDILRQLKNRNKLEPDEKEKILAIIGFFPKNETNYGLS